MPARQFFGKYRAQLIWKIPHLAERLWSYNTATALLTLSCRSDPFPIALIELEASTSQLSARSLFNGCAAPRGVSRGADTGSSPNVLTNPLQQIPDSELTTSSLQNHSDLHKQQILFCVLSSLCNAGQCKTCKHTLLINTSCVSPLGRIQTAQHGSSDSGIPFAEAPGK